MQLPFAVEPFFGVLQAYDSAVWPVQIGFLLLAALGSVVTAWVLHTAINFWASIVPAPLMGIPSPLALSPVALLLLPFYLMSSWWMFSAASAFGVFDVWALSLISL